MTGDLFLCALRRSSERAGRLVERLEAREILEDGDLRRFGIDAGRLRFVAGPTGMTVSGDAIHFSAAGNRQRGTDAAVAMAALIA